MSIVQDVIERRGIFHVSWDDGTTLKIRRKHFAKRSIEAGALIEPEEYESNIAPLQFADAYEAALTLLDYSAKSEKKLREDLIAKGYVPSVSDAAVEKLREAGLINDRELAERIAGNATHTAIGVYAARRKLRLKGISEEDVDSVLNVFDDDQQLSAAITTGRKYLRKYEELPTPEMKRKLSQALARKGFTWEIITQAIEKLTGIDCDYD